MSQIQRYVFDTVSMQYVEPEPSDERRKVVVMLTDHERDVAEQVAAAREEERNRCRQQEVKPLIDILSKAEAYGELRQKIANALAAVRKIQKELP